MGSSAVVAHLRRPGLRSCAARPEIRAAHRAGGDPRTPPRQRSDRRRGGPRADRPVRPSSPSRSRAHRTGARPDPLLARTPGARRGFCRVGGAAPCRGARRRATLRARRSRRGAPGRAPVGWADGRIAARRPGAPIVSSAAGRTIALPSPGSTHPSGGRFADAKNGQARAGLAVLSSSALGAPAVRGQPRPGEDEHHRDGQHASEGVTVHPGVAQAP